VFQFALLLDREAFWNSAEHVQVTERNWTSSEIIAIYRVLVLISVTFTFCVYTESYGETFGNARKRILICLRSSGMKQAKIKESFDQEGIKTSGSAIISLFLLRYSLFYYMLYVACGFHCL
jgi:hypothetical protein